MSSARSRAVLTAVAPALAPWVSARGGLGSGNEAGLAYTGRGFRLDARHAFDHGDVAWSIGGGATWLLPRDIDADHPDDRTHVAAPSFGFDVPILWGWQSSAGIVSLLAGVRVGYENLRGDVTLAPSLASVSPPPNTAFTADRWYGGAVVGLGLGFRHLHGRIELETMYQQAHGRFAGWEATVRGVSLAPAAGLIATF